MGLIDEVRADARRWGWRDALQHRVLSALETRLGITVHYLRRRALRAANAAPASRASLAGIEARPLRTEEVLSWAQDPHLQLGVDFVQGALARGDVCLGAIEQGNLIAYTWRAGAPVPVQDDVWAVPEPDCCYAYNAFVSPACRGRGVIGFLVLSSNEFLLSRGWNYEVSYISAHNIPSLRTTKLTGAGRSGLVAIFRIGTRRVCMHSVGRVRAGLRFVTRTVPSPVS